MSCISSSVWSAVAPDSIAFSLLNKVSVNAFVSELFSYAVLISASVWSAVALASIPSNLFFNVVVKIKTHFSLVDLFKLIKKIENNVGRKKSLRNYPRKCDIDIIDFKGLYLRTKHLEHIIETPHPRMHTRNFVIFPLFEINKTWIHPKTKAKINNIINQLNNRDFSDIRIV